MAQVPSIPLSSGTSIPQIGLGTSPMDDDETQAAVAAAIALGYRHIDTATRYGNETGVGRGIRDSGVDRDEIFITTKLDGEFQGDDKAVAGLDAALERLGTDHVDLLLMHWPLPARDLYVSTWRTFETLHADGRARAIGVSNFTPAHLTRVIEETSIIPAVNQIQINPAIPREAQVEFDGVNGIVTESYSPLGAGEGDLLADPLLAQIGREHGKSPAQVVLRWHVQRGLVVIPKSKTPERMAANLEIFDFELSQADLFALDKLSIRGEPGVDSDVDGH